MSDLFQNHAATSGPVECLGQTFPSDEARREHYLRLLAEKLKDPEFRKIDGFPIGSDEDILALSDPPYYTACPNPFLAELVSREADSFPVDYEKEPFSADVSEGKNDPIYTAQSYHTKVPHKAIMRYLLQYTRPGDVVLDGFCGTGMTGVAANLCGDTSALASLGYKTDSHGNVLRQVKDEGVEGWERFSKIGPRFAVLNDLSPVASFIAYNYNTPWDITEFNSAAERMLLAVEKKYGWMYRTHHESNSSDLEESIQKLPRLADGSEQIAAKLHPINYTIWSDVFSCPECGGEVVFWDVALDRAAGKVKDNFSCPTCSSLLSKRALDRAWNSILDAGTGSIQKLSKQVPVEINYSVRSRRFVKKPDAYDLAAIAQISGLHPSKWFPKDRMPEGDESRRNDDIGITHVHHFYTHRNLIVLAELNGIAERSNNPLLRELVINMLTRANKQSSLHVSNYFNGGGGVCKGHLSGTLYVPSISPEIPATKIFRDRIDTFNRWLKVAIKDRSSAISTQSFTKLDLPDSCVDYIFIDPPFGKNLMYSELNFIDESWLRIKTNAALEAVENQSQSKGINEYRHLMAACFKEAHRVLKPGRWMTVEFSNTQANVWNAIQTALQEAGFVVANVSALDKKQGSFKAVNTTTAVKQDLVISTYKPNGGLEERFSRTGGSEDSVWDFVRTHLHYLPTVKIREGQLEFVNERDPRIIFDRTVAWFVRHNVPVPMSTQEFQAGLAQRFAQRDGMVFLPDQVAEYDKKRASVARAPQMELFVSDERSAIDWLSDFLKRRPSTYQVIHPEFISQLGAGWKKHEEKPELAELLEANFLRFEGKGDVPPQIHSYLSTNYKDLRGLDKTSQALIAKAMDRWYVPDPNKSQDLEKKRERALLKEFDVYRSFTGRRLKEFRLEVLRVGFRAAWAEKDYQTIISIAQKIPEDALQEDEKLLTLYDLAITRVNVG
ncbi:site-specific DNA-methyltransferase [Acidithiobacillus ferridurans]|uniref:DNA methyltransferase n=1 Tax=Acidithiobacillus ferridurans TaxID=1232575 RepID=UPI001C0785A1|nr:DNA methyltransferase [Acidithiobacillus ferridurans]MBU2804264.1 site-specific DNA-methyltransferase [Acidithiobacillus ferridurans]